MKTHRWQARTRQELIIEVWEALDCESVGARELSAIQDAVRETLGSGAVASPASIARTLADEGAVLRHPEVLNCDTKWRARNLAPMITADDLNFSDLVAAAASLKVLDRLRSKAEREGNEQKLQQVRELALHCKEEVRLVARSRIVAEQNRSVAKEIAEWLSVWLLQPNLFEDWLSLRQGSSEYREKFAE